MNEIQTTTRLKLWTPPDTSDDLAIRIDAEHEACVGSARVTVEHAVNAGRLLKEKKEKLNHGEWIPWVEANCRFTRRMASNYMLAADKWETVSHLKPATLRELLALSVSSEDDNESTEEQTLFMADGETEVIEEEDICDKECESDSEQKTVSKADAAPIPWPDSERERREQAEQGTTVIANMSRDHQLIAWAQNERRFIKIDRTSPFGNPMKLDWMGNDRDAVISWYLEHWLPFVVDYLPIDSLLGGKVLGCWCYPDLCHGNAIIDYLSENHL